MQFNIFFTFISRLQIIAQYQVSGLITFGTTLNWTEFVNSDLFGGQHYLYLGIKQQTQIILKKNIIQKKMVK